MNVKIDVIYQDGEAVAFRNTLLPGKKNVLEFFRAVAFDLELCFSNADGEPVSIADVENPGKVQLLLSCRDRVLASVENPGEWSLNERGFQILKFTGIVFDSGDIRNVLADSYLEIEPNYRGRAECEFSVAVYSSDAPREAVQLFITMNALLKDTPVSR